MWKKSVIVGALFLVVLVRHGTAAPPEGNRAVQESTPTVAVPASASDNAAAFPADLLWPACRNLPLTFDQAYRLAKLGHGPKPWMLLYPPQTSAVKQELLSALADPDPQKAQKAAQFLGASTDFRVIEPLLEFARKPGQNEAGIAEAVASVISILDAKGSEDRSPAMQRRDGEADRAYYLRLCGHFENEATEWKHTTFAEYYARRVEPILHRLTPRSTDDGDRGLFYHALCEFWQTDDAERAAPLLIDWATRVARNARDYEMAIAILSRLQRYVGPLDVPEPPELAKVDETLRSTGVWWQQNKHKKPANWLLDRLAARGYATQNPEDVQATAAAIALAIKRGNPIERYAAETFLELALPDGDSICVPLFLEKQAHAYKGETKEGPIRDYLHALALERALRWCVIDGLAMTWSPDTARYEIGGGGGK
jgi:hypothetical protein